jgi:hypothetical protein
MVHAARKFRLIGLLFAAVIACLQARRADACVSCAAPQLECTMGCACEDEFVDGFRNCFLAPCFEFPDGTIMCDCTTDGIACFVA